MVERVTIQRKGVAVFSPARCWTPIARSLNPTVTKRPGPELAEQFAQPVRGLCPSWSACFSNSLSDPLVFISIFICIAQKPSVRLRRGLMAPWGDGM